MKIQHGLVVAALVVALPVTARAATGESSFTPTSLRVPLHGVRLGGSDPSQDAMLYRCAADDPDAGATDGGTPDCRVDMANDAELAALFGSTVDVRPGTYDHVSFDTCVPGASGYTVFVAGKVALGGDSYHTTYGSGAFLTTTLADALPTPVVFAGCSTTVPLPQAITVVRDDEIAIRSFFSLSNIAWAALNGNGIGGCASNGSQSVCSAMPVPVLFLGKTQPTLDTFYVTEDVTDLEATKAGGQVLLLRDAAGVPFGGFTRRFYSATSVGPQVNYDTAVKQIVQNDDAGTTFTITNWGGGSPDGTPSPYYIKFVAFELATHQGNLLSPFSLTLIPYRAVKQP